MGEFEARETSNMIEYWVVVTAESVLISETLYATREAALDAIRDLRSSEPLVAIALGTEDGEE